MPDEAPGEDLSLEGPSAGGRGPQRSSASAGAAWDQFATNQQMFGVQSSFNEDLYTTKLDPRCALCLHASSQTCRLPVSRWLSSTACSSVLISVQVPADCTVS